MLTEMLRLQVPLLLLLAVTLVTSRECPNPPSSRHPILLAIKSVLQGPRQLANLRFTFEEDDRCYNTPEGGPGNCIIIHTCPLILNLLKQKPLRPDTIQRLQSAQCGFDRDTPKVCCPQSGGAPLLPNPTGDSRPPPNQQNNNNRPPGNTSNRPFNNNNNRPPNNNNNNNRPPPNNNRPLNGNNNRPATPPVTAQGGTPPAVNLNHPRLNLLPVEECGVRADDRIVNGKRAALGQFPWMARIGYNTRTGESYRCGGSVISKRYVLTAAHCISNLPSSLQLVSVQLGEHDATMDPDCADSNGVYYCMPSPQKFKVERAIPHPQYSPTNLQNDIGLIRLDKDADLTFDSVRAVCLPVGNIQFRNLDNAKALTVSGWGTTENGSASTDLLFTTIPAVTNEQCKTIYQKQAVIVPSQICAGGATQDSCDGDSGGPLTMPDAVGNDPSPREVQVGVVSYGPVRCGTRGMPGVYTRIGHHLSWILDNMAP